MNTQLHSVYDSSEYGNPLASQVYHNTAPLRLRRAPASVRHAHIQPSIFGIPEILQRAGSRATRRHPINEGPATTENALKSRARHLASSRTRMKVVSQSQIEHCADDNSPSEVRIRDERFTTGVDDGRPPYPEYRSFVYQMPSDRNYEEPRTVSAIEPKAEADISRANLPFDEHAAGREPIQPKYGQMSKTTKRNLSRTSSSEDEILGSTTPNADSNRRAMFFQPESENSSIAELAAPLETFQDLLDSLTYMFDGMHSRLSRNTSLATAPAQLPARLSAILKRAAERKAIDTMTRAPSDIDITPNVLQGDITAVLCALREDTCISPPPESLTSYM